MTVAEMSKRLQNLENQITLSEIRRKEEAEKAVRALSNITNEQIEVLKAIVPEIEVVRAYSVAQLAENKNGEVEAVRKVYDKLCSYVSKRIEYYEQGLTDK